jgi:DNA repair photolyase
VDQPIKGRGALSNPPDRFSRTQGERVDDGWYVESAPTFLETCVEPDRARSVISHNDSPDIGFEQSINAYRGCEHGCVYCVSGDTQILMADGTTRAIADVRAGDSIYGTQRAGWYRRYVKTQVLAHWSVIKAAYRITLEDGTQLVAGADHRFLTERGWKFVQGTECGPQQRPHLTLANKLMGTGAFAARVPQDAQYRAGYLCGMIRGDALLKFYSYQWNFRLALCDSEALIRTRDWLSVEGVETRPFVFFEGSAVRKPMHAIRTYVRHRVLRIHELIAWPDAPSRSWHAGFLAGIFDAEGSYSCGVLRISNTDPEIIDRLGDALRALDFRFVIERITREKTKDIEIVRLVGGLREHLRFFHTVDPAITRKRDISGQSVKSEARLRVLAIEPLGRSMRLYDISTGTEDFIANGVVSHNCYARPSHAYMGLSSGLDFETRLFFKENAAQRLTEELARPRYVCKPIAMGTNTDPYQPLEKRLEVTRSILEVLERCHHPVTIVTKSTLILRDLELLAALAREQLVSVAISVTSLDPEIKRTLEPRTASPRARLTVIERLAAAGVPVGVMVAPVIPVLTDHEMERIVAAAAEAGASSAAYVLLRLPYEVKDLFREWLAQHHPLKAQHVMTLINELRGGADYDSRFGTRMRGTGPYAQLLKRRFELACQRSGIDNSRRLELETAQFIAPRVSSAPAAPTPQLSLFDPPT